MPPLYGVHHTPLTEMRRDAMETSLALLTRATKWTSAHNPAVGH
jgi:hypothetical protein